jgi:hypothetical protein
VIAILAILVLPKAFTVYRSSPGPSVGHAPISST